jgi:hypothetical protein
MGDRFESIQTGLDSPASHGFPITPSDGTDLAETVRAVFVGGSGSLVAVLASGAELTFAGLAGGTVLPIRARRVKATGTSATLLVGLL